MYETNGHRITSEQLSKENKENNERSFCILWLFCYQMREISVVCYAEVEIEFDDVMRQKGRLNR